MTETATGKVGAVSDYNDKDYYNIALGDPENGDWYIGNDSTDLEKGQKVKITYKNDNQIEEINIIEEDNEDAQSVQNSNTGNGGEGSNSSKSSSQHLSERQAGIIATASVNQARDTVTTSYEDNKQKHLERVDELSQAYNNIMKDRMRENTQ